MRKKKTLGSRRGLILQLALFRGCRAGRAGCVAGRSLLVMLLVGAFLGALLGGLGAGVAGAGGSA